MKVCIFTNHFFPEDFKVNDIAFELANKGHDVTVITAVPDYPKGIFFDGYSWVKKCRETVNRCNVIRLPIIPRGRGNNIVLVIHYISFFISSSIYTFFHKFFHKYDAVFVHLTSPFFIGIPAMKLKLWQKIPMIFWVLDLWPESLTAAAGIKNKFIIRPLMNMVKKVYNNCDKILIGSRGFEKSILEKGDFASKLVYFPNWSESDFIHCDTSVYEQVNPFASFSEDDFVLLFAGNLGEAQNLECIINAAIILKDYANIKFVFLGDGRARKLLEELSKNNAILNKTVFFPGRFPIESMPYFMSKASALLVSLKDELIFNLTVPSKVQFYMAQGKPILALLNGEGADLLKTAQCGYAVPAGDTDSFVQLVLEMSKLDKEILMNIGLNGKEYYNRYFRKEDRINHLCNVLEIYAK